MSGASDRPAQRAALLGVVTAIVLVLLAGLWFGMQRSDRQLGNNAVGFGLIVALPAKGQTVCINSPYVAEDSKRVGLYLSTMNNPGAPGAPVNYQLTLKHGSQKVSSEHSAMAHGFRFVDIPPTPWPVQESTNLCVTPTDGTLGIGGGTLNPFPGEPVATLEGQPLAGTGEPSVHWYSAADDQPRQLSKIVSVFRHSQVWHGPLYPWLMLLSLLAALAASAFGLWALITAPRHSVKKLAWIFTVVAFAWFASWSIMTPIFQGNDESEHFANVEHLAMTGHPPDPSQISPLPAYSTHQGLSMLAAHQNSLVIDDTARPFWSTDREAALAARQRGTSRSDGGGFTVSASGHSGLYYALFSPLYRATTWMQPANQLVVLRIFNSAAAALVALFAVLCCALLLGESRKRAAAVAGALIAFQPMFGYVSGAINNDTFVNVTGAATIYLLLLLACKGWTVRREVALGVIAVLGPIGKLTGAASSIYAAAWIAVLLIRDRTGRAVRGGATILATVVATAASWLLVTSIIGWQSTLINVHTDPPTNPPEWASTLPQRLDYIFQQLIPWIHFTGPMTMQSFPFARIYIVGGFADLFWHRISYPIPVYGVIAAVLAFLVACGLLALWRYRSWAREHWVPLAMILLYPCFVYFLVEWQYAVPGGRDPVAEQGRYIFPAIAALAVAAAGAPLGLKPRWRPYVWGAVAGALFAFSVVTWFFGAYHVYA
jgi:hypothetical protein